MNQPSCLSLFLWRANAPFLPALALLGVLGIADIESRAVGLCVLAAFLLSYGAGWVAADLLLTQRTPGSELVPAALLAAPAAGCGRAIRGVWRWVGSQPCNDPV